MPTGDFVAYWSPWRVGMLTIFAALFFVGGLWIVGAFGPPPASDRYSPEVQTIAGWASILLFGLCFVVMAKRLFDRNEQVHIGRTGIRLAVLTGRTIPWSEITNVTIWSYKSHKTILLHLRDPARFRSDIPFADFVARINRMTVAGDVHISLTGTDRSFDEAMQAIRRFWR